jgi:cytochrome c-type biogenesis protein CcmF
MRVRKGGRDLGTLRPTRGYYPTMAPDKGPVAGIFDGQATSEVGLRAGLRRDLWTAIEPDIGPLQPFIAEADRRFANAGPGVQGVVVAALVQRYVQHPPPAQFRIIDSPLVAWIWIGSLIAFGGGLLALWPVPAVARRRATASARAGAAREPARA